MKYDLIKTDNYLLIVDDSEIKEGDYCTTHLNIIDVGKIHNSYTIFHPTTKEHLNDLKSCKKVIAHLPLNNSPILEGVDLLPPYFIHQEDGIDKYAESCNQLYKEWLVTGYKSGYNKAKEKYKYTEEDIINAWNTGYVNAITKDEKTDFKYFIQSLEQPKYPIAFECDTDYYGGDVKWKIETTTNSQGQIEWVGKYIY